MVHLWFCIQNEGQQNWEVVCAKEQMSSVKGESNQLPAPQSAFHRWPTVFPLFTEWARYFSAHTRFMQPHQCCLYLLNLFHWKHSCPFGGGGGGAGAFLPHNWAVTIMHMTSEIRFLFRGSYRGCLPSSPSIYPALRPTSHLSPVLQCRCPSKSAAARTGLPWSYAIDHL